MQPLMYRLIALTLVAFTAGSLGCASGELDAEVGVDSQPKSLVGTEVDGQLNVDAAGAFVLDADAVALFDYFLTTEGEIDDPARQALVAAEARAALGVRGGEVMEWWSRYTEYRRRFDAAIAKAGPEASLDEVLDRVRVVRAETVGEHPLFVEDEALVEQAVAAKQAFDARSPEGMRRLQLAAMLTTRTEADVLASQAARAPLRLRHAEAVARAEIVDAAEAAEAVRALRVEQVGLEAAGRLAALDARRAAFQARVDAFAAEVEGLAQAERAALLTERFDPREARRVRTMLDWR